MILLVILSFIQLTVIPGILILKIANFQGTILQRIIYAFALSLIANYLLIFILVSIHFYGQISVLAIFVGELAGLAWLHRKDFQLPVFDVLQNQIDNFKNTINSLILPNKEHDSDNALIHQLYVLLRLVFFICALAGIIWTTRLFAGNLVSVFNAWDAVVSWNRWALVWTSGQIPLDSGFYPQLIPANWSLAYVLVGNTIIQAVAKGIMPLFAVFLLLSLLDLGLNNRSFGYFIAGTIAFLLMKNFLESEITSGYVDVAVSFFGLLAIHALIQAGSKNDPFLSNQYLLLGAVFAAGAGITKQPGMYIFVLYPVLAYLNVIRKHDPGFKKIKKYLVSFLLVSLIPLSWYLLKLIHFTQNIETFYIQEYFDVTANTYGNIDLGAQIIAALSRLNIYLVLFLFIIAGFPLLSSFYRALVVLIVFPYPVIWAWIAGYDTRNLAIFLPIFALTAGVALEELYLFLIKILQRTQFVRLKTGPILVILFILAVLGSIRIPSGNLMEQQTQLRMQIFSPSKNEKIYAIIQQDGPNTKILTNYPIRYLPGLEDNHVQFGFQNFDTFITWVDDPSIQYLLINNRASDQIKSYIDGKINEGDYELVFIDKEWVKYTMIRIINR